MAMKLHPQKLEENPVYSLVMFSDSTRVVCFTKELILLDCV
jgi:hypothetical protein